MNMRNSIRYLSRQNVEDLQLPMSTIIDLVSEALVDHALGQVQMPSKQWMEVGDRWFDGMAALIERTGYTMMKSQSGSASNALLRMPYLNGMLLLTEIKTGLIVAAMDVSWICQQRTAAASALAIRHLANPGMTSYSMLGAGVQGFSHFEAFRLVMPDLKEVVIYDIDPRAARKFADHVEEQGYHARIVNSAREAVDNSEVFVTAGPIELNLDGPITSEWLRPGTTAISIDFDCYWVAGKMNDADLVFTDDSHQLEHIKESGYFLNCRHADAELGQVISGAKTGRTSASQKVVALNLGIGIQDLVTAIAVNQMAIEKGIGTILER